MPKSSAAWKKFLAVEKQLQATQVRERKAYGRLNARSRRVRVAKEAACAGALAEVLRGQPWTLQRDQLGKVYLRSRDPKAGRLARVLHRLREWEHGCADVAVGGGYVELHWDDGDLTLQEGPVPQNGRSPLPLAEAAAALGLRLSCKDLNAVLLEEVEHLGGTLALAEACTGFHRSPGAKLTAYTLRDLLRKAADKIDGLLKKKA